MAEQIFRLLTGEEVKSLYTERMEEDFLADELKPLATLLSLMKRGIYDPYALFENGTLVAYAFYWKAEEEKPYVMLDYFAVVPQERNKGRGSALLREMLERFCRGGKGVFGEVEVPDTEDEAVDDLRRRRIGFYKRSGMRVLDFKTKCFGVPFHVIAYGPEIPDEELMEIDRAIYRTACDNDAIFARQIFIPWSK